MSKKRYILASPEGINFYRLREQVEEEPELGQEVQLELDGEEQEIALVAAGWLSHSGKKGDA